MTAVLLALGSMGAVVGLGWLTQARRLLPSQAREVLAAVSFTIAAPCLLFVTLARTDLATVVSRPALVTWGTTAALALVLAATARWALRLPPGAAVMTTLAGSYVNAGNLGIPLAVYLFGDALAVVPSLLIQLLVLAPLAFAVLDRTTVDRAAVPGRRRGGAALAALRNPVTLGTLAGVVASLAGSALGHRIAEPVLAPFELLGAAAPPLALLTFGMTLALPRPGDAGGDHAGAGRTGAGRTGADHTEEGGAAVVPPGRERWAVLLAVLARNVVHPLAAWAVGRAVGLEASALAVVVTMAALPTAQNVVVYATRYRCFEGPVSRACLATTAACVPVLLVIGALLPA
ncbi:AEC family transporter [Antribacter sp. KLBMP9083]|uniref:AEC family transporter n=1 Tax=Antribacter soli TaxID=2910976 RepID=A0AA41U5Q2_9MICO|nr:AEC family transporter [Antribacter soli]MCF4119475.1 AEC family transporter [Antribacter soli]